MFWRFGGYTAVSTIDTILDKPEISLEELLDESDLTQELKNNAKLVEYLREDSTLTRLVDLITTPVTIESDDEQDDVLSQDEDGEKDKRVSRGHGRARGKHEERNSRNEEARRTIRHGFVATEIIASEVWSITEAFMDNAEHIQRIWKYLHSAPDDLDAQTAGLCSRVVEHLVEKKTAATLASMHACEGIVPALLKHIDCPVIMDLLIRIISMAGQEGGQGIVDWFQEQDLIPTLLNYLGPSNNTFTQTSAGDFLKAVITISANASQNDQSCIGPNSLTRQLVTKPCVEKLIKDMLTGGNALTQGVGVIIEVIRKNNSDYDPEPINLALEPTTPTSGDPIFLGPLLREFAAHVKDFMDLLNAPSVSLEGEDRNRPRPKDAFGKPIEPLGFDRFKTCELMAELLHCSNMGLLNERGAVDHIRQKDAERERLRQAGLLQAKLPSKLTLNQSFMSTGTESYTEEERRKLGVMNSGDDDDFMEVKIDNDAMDEDDDFGEMQSAEAEDEKVELDEKSGLGDVISVPAPSEAPPAVPGSQEKEKDLETVEDIDETNLKLENLKISDDNTKPSTNDLLFGEIAAQLSPKKEGDANPFEETEHKLSAAHEQELKPVPSEEQAAAGAPAPLFATSSPEHQEEAEINPDAPGLPTRSDEDAKYETREWVSEDGQLATTIVLDTDGEILAGDYLKIMFVEHKVVPTILDFFFRFPWNNFLHNVVYDVVQQVFNGTMDRGFNPTLAIDLYQSGCITDRIIEGQLRSDEMQNQHNVRQGYMGHLTLIAEEVVKFTDRNPPEFLSEPVLDKIMSPIWMNYVENVLAETRERDNIILGGQRPEPTNRPARGDAIDALDASSGLSEAAQNALFEAGLTSLSDTSSFPSGLDNVEFDSDEDDANETPARPGLNREQAVDLPSNPAGAQSAEASALAVLSPTSIDPTDPPNHGTSAESVTNTGAGGEVGILPPPLNVAPTRARRQLAARLAAKQGSQASSNGDLDLKSGAAEEISRHQPDTPITTDAWTRVESSSTQDQRGRSLLGESHFSSPEHDEFDSSPWNGSPPSSSARPPSSSTPATQPPTGGLHRNRSHVSNHPSDWVSFDHLSGPHNSSSSSASPTSSDDEDSEYLEHDISRPIDLSRRSSNHPIHTAYASLEQRSLANYDVDVAADEDSGGEDVPIAIEFGSRRTSPERSRKPSRAGVDEDSSGSVESSPVLRAKDKVVKHVDVDENNDEDGDIGAQRPGLLRTTSARKPLD